MQSLKNYINQAFRFLNINNAHPTRQSGSTLHSISEGYFLSVNNDNFSRLLNSTPINNSIQEGYFPNQNTEAPLSQSSSSSTERNIDERNERPLASLGSVKGRFNNTAAINELNLLFSGGLKNLSENLIQYLKEHPEILNSASIGPLDAILKNSYLLSAIASNQTDVACYLIELDVQVKASTLNQADKYITGQNTPLLLACKKANWNIVRKLLEQKEIDVRCKDHFGLSPLHWAAIQRAPKEIIESLFHAGAHDYEIKFKPESHHTYSAKCIYEEEISYAFDLFYPEHLNKRMGDSEDFIGTLNPIFSDLHWHISDIIKNAFEHRDKEIKKRQSTDPGLRMFGEHIEHAKMIFSEEREKLPIHKNLFPEIA